MTAPGVAHPLVGRAAELDRLDAAMDEVRVAGPRVVLCSGAVGVGKTALLRLFADRAAQHGATVMWPRAFGRPGAPPYWIWQQVAGPNRLFGSPPLSADRAAIAERIADQLRSVSAGQPTVLVLDDLDRVDDSSLLTTLPRVRRALGRSHLLVCCAYPSDAPHTSEWSAMRRDLKAAAATEEMLLTGLMAEDVRRLLISSGLAAPGPDLVDQVVATTAGNPLFIVELARHLTLGGPDRPEVPLPRTLGDLVRYRLDALPESGRRVLGAASILGERFRVGDLARALGLDAALIARQLVRSGPDDVGELGELADQMLAVSASTGRADLEMWGRLWRIDTHWYAGRLSAIASETAGLQRCAERADGPYARWHLLSTRGMLALARAEFDDGQRIFGEAVELLTRIDHPAVHGASVAFGLLLGHHRGHSVKLLDASAWDFGADVRWDLFSRLARAFVVVDDGQLDEAAALYNRCGDPANWAIPSGGRLVALAIAARVATSLGALDDVAKLGKWLVPYRGRFVAAGGGSGNFLGPVDLALGRCSASLGHYDAARRDLEAAGTMCRTVGAPGFGVEADTELAAVHASVGDNAAAALVARRAQPMARTLGMTPWADGLATFAGRDAHIDPLTARERQIASLVAAGLSNRAIADRLVISDRTAQNHVQHILGKLGFTNRAQIAAWASRQSQ